jgi:hypothetical protein
MTESILAKQPARLRYSTLRTGLSNTLVVMGILYCLGGLCLGTGLFMALTLQAGWTAATRAESWQMLSLVAVESVGTLASGCLFFWTGRTLTRGVRSAAVMALVVALINFVAVVGYMIFAIAVSINRGVPRVSPFIVGLMLYGTVALTNAIVSRLLWRLLRKNAQA